MKVGVVTASLSRLAGGVFESVRGQTITTSRAPGVKLQVIGISDPMTTQDLPEWGPVEVIVCDRLGPARFGYSPDLIAAVASANPDILHFHGLWTYQSLASNFLFKRSRRPYIVSPHGMLDKWALNHSYLKKAFAWALYEKKNLSHAGCIHALSESEAESIRQLGFKNPIAIIPNGTTLSDIYKGEPAPSCKPSQGTNEKYVLYLGRLHPKKGLRELILGWNSMSRIEREGWRLLIAGWSENGYDHVLKELVRDLGLANQISFIGSQHGNNKFTCLKNASAFILPSFSEGLPMAILEAWSCALPVIMTENCNLLIGFRRNAALECKPNADSVARALVGLFKMSDSQRTALGQRGRQLVEEEFTWSKVSEDFVAVYRWLTCTGPRPDCVHETQVRGRGSENKGVI